MTIEVPVLIAGGGMSGLTTALQLARFGIRSLVVERHASTSHLPKAHTLNVRTMEIFRQLGIADELLAEAVDPKHIQLASWRTSFGGSEPYDGKIVVSIDTFGGGSLAEHYQSISPMKYSSFHQVRLEPFLARQITKSPLIDIRFETEATDYSETTGGAVITIRDRKTGESEEVHAEYVVAADGGKFFQSRMGYSMEGVTGLGDQVSIWFKADLSPWMDDESLLNWFITPDSFGMAAGVLVPVGPGRQSDEWVLHFGYPAGEGAGVSDEEAVRRLVDLFQLPDLDFEVVKISRWNSEQVIADRFRAGRVIATGDAIHRHVPTLGIGMNSAIGDSHNLAWKLAYVIRGYAPDALLDTFEEERRPILERNGELALQTFYLHLAMLPSIGMVPGAPSEFNKRVLTRYFEDSVLGADRRERARQLVAGHQSLEHQALDLEVGYRYSGSMIVADPDVHHVPDPTLTNYVPSTDPGARLAHAWLTSPDGARVSTLDLIRSEHTLIVGSADTRWAAAAADVADQLGLPITVVVIGEGGFTPEPAAPGAGWADLSGIREDGALLVRPDQHVAWRSAGASETPDADLRSALVISEPVLV